MFSLNESNRYVLCLTIRICLYGMKETRTIEEELAENFSMLLSFLVLRKYNKNYTN